ncbi:reverse transcriptase domain-containing protein [Tanacetum coccineum]
MSTQFYSNQIKLHFPNPEKSLQFHRVEESESDNLFYDHIQGEDENAEDVQMANHLRPMEELLQIPIVGIEDAIVVPAVLANEFELKIELLNFISNSPFFGLDNDDPHSHIKRFYQITQTFKINQVPHDVVKLILFPFSLKGAAETWLENEPPCSITTWDDLVSKFLNRFYPHSKTRELKKEITNFQQVFNFFYNELSQSDQDSLNTIAGGNLMSKNTQEALTIIENKAKVRTFRNKPQVSSNDGTSTQIDAIAALTKQVEALEEKSSGSTTSHSNHSLPEYESFCFDVDHIKEKSNGSTTSHSDLSKYESFHFDLSIDPLPPANRNPGELTRRVEENISEDSTKELTSPELNDLRFLLSDCDSIFSEIRFPSENKDKIFDPGIFIIKGVQSLRFHILPLDDFSTISFVSDSLFLTDPSEIETFISFPFGNEDKVFDPEILLINEVLSFIRKTPHLLSDNFKIDKHDIFSELSLKIKSLICFHPKDKEIWGESS